MYLVASLWCNSVHMCMCVHVCMYLEAMVQCGVVWPVQACGTRVHVHAHVLCMYVPCGLTAPVHVVIECVQVYNVELGLIVV